MNRLRLLCVLQIVFLLIGAGTARAQSFAATDAWLNAHTGDLGGRAALLVYHNGHIVYSKSVSEMSPRQKMVTRMRARRQGDEASTEPFGTNSRAPIASSSKWLSAALVMTFVDEGRLHLTDSIGRWLPAMTRAGKGSITIAQCLSHTTAIKGAGLLEDLQSFRNARNMDDAVDAMAALPMEGAPGTVFHYSNAGMQLAAAVIEKISKQSFATLFANRIATPLRMSHTDYGKGPVPLAAGGAQSTADDYLHFLIMILNKGTYEGTRVLSEASIRAMQGNRLTSSVRIAYTPAKDPSMAGYGLGEWLPSDTPASGPARVASSPGLFGAFPWVSNEKGYCAFLLVVNMKNAERTELYKELKELVEKGIR